MPYFRLLVLSCCLSVCLSAIHPTAKVSQEVNRKRLSSNTILQLSTPYSNCQTQNFKSRLNEIGGRTRYNPSGFVQFWFWRLPIRQSFKLPNAKPERERECVKVKTLTYSPSTDSYYSKIYILCIASFSVACMKYQLSWPVAYITYSAEIFVFHFVNLRVN